MMRELLKLMTLRGLRYWEDDPDEEEDDQESEEEAEEDDEGESDEEEDSEDDDKKPKKKVSKAQQQQDEEVDRLRKALKKERLARRQAQRDARAAKRPQKATGAKKKAPTPQEQEEEAQRADELAEAERRVTRLAERLKNSALDSTIAKMAPKFKFADVDDAVALVNRRNIVVDQDNEDPTDLEIDEDSVRDALRDLARKKPHLLAKPKSKKSEEDEDDEGDEEPKPKKRGTGSKFSGKSRRGDATSEEQLRGLYPGLGPKRG